MNEFVSYRQLNKEKFDVTFPLLSNFVRVAERGQQWKFG